MATWLRVPLALGLLVLVVMGATHYRLWTLLATVRAHLVRLEPLEVRLERAAASSAATGHTLRTVRLGLLEVAREQLPLVVLDHMVAVGPSEAPNAAVVDALKQALQGRCRDSQLVVSVGAEPLLDLLPASLGCSVAAYHPFHERQRVLSWALNECGRRVMNEPRAVLWNSTEVSTRRRVEPRGSSYVLVAGNPATSTETTTLAAHVHQNVALLHVATPQWQPVLQGLRGTTFRIRSVLLSAAGVGGDEQWALLSALCDAFGWTAHTLAPPRRRIMTPTALRAAGGLVWLQEHA